MINFSSPLTGLWLTNYYMKILNEPHGSSIHVNKALFFFCTNHVDELGPYIFYLGNLSIPLSFLLLSGPNIKTWINTKMCFCQTKVHKFVLRCAMITRYSWRVDTFLLPNTLSNLSFIITYLTPLLHPHIRLILCLGNLTYPISQTSCLYASCLTSTFW